MGDMLHTIRGSHIPIFCSQTKHIHIMGDMLHTMLGTHIPVYCSQTYPHNWWHVTHHSWQSNKCILFTDQIYTQGWNVAHHACRTYSQNKHIHTICNMLYTLLCTHIPVYCSQNKDINKNRNGYLNARYSIHYILVAKNKMLCIVFYASNSSILCIVLCTLYSMHCIPCLIFYVLKTKKYNRDQSHMPENITNGISPIYDTNKPMGPVP